MLNTSNYSITEIAGMVGFNYSSHFIQIFKKKMHKTPNEYRKKTTN
ncbi:helix-turn-helix domain-containing protein [Irregularibacter muris]